VPIWVHNVEDLVGGKVVLAFDDSIIRLVYPPVNNEYLVPPGYPSWFTPILPPYVTPADITHTDIVTVDISLVIGDRPLMVPVGKNGSGDFFWLCFRAVGSGWSYINILESELLHTPMPGYTTIPHNWINGGVTIKDRVISGTVWLEGRNTDNAGGVFVVNSQTGDVLDVSDNYGRYSFCPPAGGGNLQIRLEKDGYLYAEEWITIPVSGVKELSRVMLLGGDPIGRSDWYIIPPTIPMTYPPVTCTEPITTPFKSQNPPNGIVEILDLTFTGSRLGKTPADPNWQATRMPPAEDERCYPYGWYVDPADLDPITMQPKIKAKNHYRADINEDAKVSIQDLVLVGLNFGETAPIDWSP